MNTRSLDNELMDLLGLVATRDDTALRALYERTSHRLLGLAFRIVGDRNLAEDVLQDAFLGIWKGAESYESSLSPPMAWMGLIVRSRALDALRKRTADRAGQTQALDETLEAELEGDSPNPVDVADASEQALALHQCMSRLEHRQREVLSLAYLQDRSHSELAQQLALPLGTVKSWIRRGLDQLRRCMSHYV